MDIDRLPLATEDPTAYRAEALRELFPEAFAEGRIDFDRLKQALGEEVFTGRERYGLTWAGKGDAVRAIQIPSVATLKPCREESVCFDGTGNAIIEGDNLEVLKLLQKSYHGRVKLIYIDPPYNTGNDFIYPDNFHEGLDEYLRFTGQVGAGGERLTTNTETSGRYHSKWLSMIYPRLFLARNLLRQDGAIFVSIDDHEVHNLRAVMDEIFGEENFVASFIWQKRYSRDNRPVVGAVHDYVLLYAKDAAAFAEVRNLLPPDETSTAVYRNPNNDPRGRWRPIPMTAQGTRPNQMYKIKTPTGVVHEPPKGRCWSMIEPEYLKLLDKGRIWFGTDGDGQPNVIRYLSEVEGFVPWTWWPHTEVGHTDEAKKEAHGFFGKEEAFDTPKPVRLMKRILHLATDKQKGDIVLDFFAGSCTMAQAVLELNQEDGGDRRFIMVQLPEPTDNPEYPTIADMGEARVRQAIQQLNRAKKGELPLGDGAAPDRGFKVFKLAESNFRIWDADGVGETPDALPQLLTEFASNVRAGAAAEDVLFEILLKAGLDLNAERTAVAAGDQTYYSIAGGDLAVCVEPHIAKETLAAMIAAKPRRIVCLDSSFDGNDALKTNTVLQMQDAGIQFQTV